MRGMMRRCVAAAGLALWMGSGAAWAHPADEMVRESAGRVMEMARAAKGGTKADREKAVEAARAEARRVFDYDAMARLAVGKHWRKATPEQRERVSRSLEGMLARMYAGALFALADAKVTFREAVAEGDEAKIRSELARPGAPTARIEYRLRRADCGPECWKVYDISVDGVSLIASQRTTFSEIVSREGFEGLIKAMEAKGSSEPALGKAL